MTLISWFRDEENKSTRALSKSWTARPSLAWTDLFPPLYNSLKVLHYRLMINSLR